MKEKSKYIIGKKIGMTQIFNEEGVRIPVTVIEAGPCYVIQKKTLEKDGYNAIQLGYQEVKEKKMNKAKKGHLEKHTIDKNIKILQEFRVSNVDDFNNGDEVNIGSFNDVKTVDVSSVSIGKGFAGTVKRWNFTIGPKGHGSKSHRIPGSIGGGTGQSKVFKGKKMPGRMGTDKVTIKNLKVIKIDEEKNLLMINGPVSGSKDAIVRITAS
jgi:large subunit ribosomal protein L3